MLHKIDNNLGNKNFIKIQTFNFPCGILNFQASTVTRFCWISSKLPKWIQKSEENREKKCCRVIKTPPSSVGILGPLMINDRISMKEVQFHNTIRMNPSQKNTPSSKDHDVTNQFVAGLYSSQNITKKRAPWYLRFYEEKPSIVTFIRRSDLRIH